MLAFVHAGRLGPAEIAFWFTVTAAATVLTGRAIWTARGGPGIPGRAAALLVTPWYLLVAPWSGIVIVGLAFVVGRAHPLVQYNDARSVAGWSLWVEWWPALVLGSLGSLVVAVVGLVVAGARWRAEPHQGRRIAAWAAAIGADALSVACTVGNFPSA